MEYIFVYRPNLLGFNVWIEIDLDIACGPKMPSF